MNAFDVHDYHPYREGMKHKAIRLRSGETLLVAMADEPHDFKRSYLLHVIEPTLFGVERQVDANGKVNTMLYMNSWMMMCDSDTYTIPLDWVVTMGDIEEDLCDQYVKFVRRTAFTKAIQRYQKEHDAALAAFLTEVHGVPVRFVDEPAPDVEDTSPVISNAPAPEETAP